MEQTVNRIKKSTILLAGAVAGVAAYALFVRPHHMVWGSTWRERSRIWLGDELMPKPLSQATRSLTIDAPADCVWRWIAQLGQDRGGFYSYTPLENLLGCEMKNADEIHPEWQDRAVGDKVWLTTPTKYDGSAHMIVARWVPGKCLVLVTPQDWNEIHLGNPALYTVWSLIVEPVSPTTSRLIARSLAGSGHSNREKIINYAFWEPAHFIMERAMMLGIKERAEKENSASLPRQIFQTTKIAAEAARQLHKTWA